VSENIFCYKKSVPKSLRGQPNEVPITLKVPGGMVQLLDDLATTTERTRSAVARMLIVKGLRLYEYDGTLLDVPLTSGKRVMDVDFGKRESGGKKTKTG
jgi:hypothetical protein